MSKKSPSKKSPSKGKGKAEAPAAAPATGGGGNIPDVVIAKLLDRKNFSFYKGTALFLSILFTLPFQKVLSMAFMLQIYRISNVKRPQISQNNVY